MSLESRLARLETLVRQLQGLSKYEVRAFCVNGSTGALFFDPIGNADVSVARTAVGRYTATWTRPWPNGSYVTFGTAFSGTSGIGIFSLDNTIAYGPAQFGFMTIDSTAFADITSMIVAVGPLPA